MHVRLGAALAGLLLSGAQALWPKPTFVSLGNTVLKVSPDLEFWRVFKVPSLPYAAHKLIADAIIRAHAQIHDGFVPWMLHTPGTIFDPGFTNSTDEITRITVTQTGVDPTYKPINGSYSLEINLNGRINITAEHSAGLLNGLNTLSQLFYTSSDGTTVYTKNAPVMIRDDPAFDWRGLNLDVARSFIPVGSIKGVIQAMSWNKMNRLHLHITDSQSWPLEIPAIPDLSLKGAMKNNSIYTKEDLADLQTYASDRGIQLVTEIDVPGHTASISKSHPELITGYNVQAKSFNDSTTGSLQIATKDWSAYCAVSLLTKDFWKKL